MFQTNFHPRAQLWQARMTRLRAMPRWGWIAILIGIVLPVVVLGAGLLVIALLSGLAVLVVVAVVMTIVNAVRRLFRKPADDGRRNVRIVVHSARVIDP
jgi:hypothetical protein